MKENNTFVPDKIVILKGSFTTKITYIAPNNTILGLRNIFKSISKEVEDSIVKGKVPQEWKNQIKVFNNIGFTPQIKKGNTNYGDSEYTLVDINRDIRFHNNLINDSIFEIGLEEGKFLYDYVVAFDYSDRYYYFDTTKEFPTNIKLIKSGTQKELDYRKNFKNSCNFYSNTDLSKGLKVGNIYKIKGNNIYDSYIVYLGYLKFANGSIRVPYNPGGNYKGIHTFVNYVEIKNKKDLEIHTRDLDTILCDVTNSYSQVSFQEINEIITRFEMSMWSWKFWNTPGLVEKFEVLNEEKLPPDFINHLSRFRCSMSQFFHPDVIIPGGNNQEVKVVKLNNYYFRSCGNFVYLIESKEEYFKPAILNCKDKTKPLLLEDASTTETNINWLGGVEWINRSKYNDKKYPSNNVLSYIANDGKNKYCFKEIFHFLCCGGKELYKTAVHYLSIYKSYFIADKL